MFRPNSNLLCNLFWLFLSAIATVGFTNAYGLDSDRSKPAQFAMDTLTYNRFSGIGLYQGHVSITQGTTKIFADKITSYSDQQNKLLKAIAIGSPVYFETQPKPNQSLIHGKADRMEYDPVKNIVVMAGNAKVVQGTDQITSPWISYDIKQGLVKTRSNGNSSKNSGTTKSQRTTIIIQPQAK
jgi:lipopolysaccharide export system protein LptA